MTYLVIALVLLVCGWDLGWWQAWLYSGLLLIAGLGAHIWSEKRHPGLMLERTKFGKSKNVQLWDKILSPLMAVSMTFPLVIVAGLDHQFGWSADFSIWVNILGFILVALGYTFAGWAMVVNQFFLS